MNQWRANGERKYLQTSEDINLTKHAKQAKATKVAHKATYADELADGDKMDDIQANEDEREDFDENGYVALDQKINISNQELLDNYMELTEGDYGYETNMHFFEHNHIMPDSHI